MSREATNIEKRPKISIVVAVTRDKLAIGNGEHLLVRIKDDLGRFKALTIGHPLIMGRKTHESIGRALPGRTNIIVTRNQDFQAEGCVVVSSLAEAIQEAGQIDDEVHIGGGGEIYKQALPYADKLYLTIVDTEIEGDIFFPDWRDDFKKETFREERFDEETGLKYTWVDLERTSPKTI